MAQPEVLIEQGKLCGSTGTDFNGDPFFKFQGIPYAKPPIGELRFKAPQPPEKWSGVFDATKEGDSCFARDPLKNGALGGSENCLFLNVYTKQLPVGDGSSLNPVLFWIHGGAFTFGSGNEDLYGPEFLLTENVVVVTINYRLGLLGFASFEDPSLDIPGNAGLKDQVMALKWVQNNISKFGGDPNNVTIFGESAGGASVHLLTLSPMAKGLFHKAIVQSGCALNPWVQGTRGSKLLAKAMGLEGANEKTIHDALVQKSVKELIEIQDKMGDKNLPNERRALGFVVEKNAKKPFLDEEPLKIMESGRFNQVPLIIGFTSEFHRKPDDPELSVENAIPWFFDYDETKSLCLKIEKFYFGGKDDSQELIRRKLEMFSDSFFIYGIYVTVKSQIPHSEKPIYLYKMTVESGLNLMKKFLGIEVPGVAHGDDITYLFKNIMTPEIKPGTLEYESLKKFVKLWTNFAKFGNPTPNPDDPLLKSTWKPVGQNFELLEISPDLVPVANPNLAGVKFWSGLYIETPSSRQN